MIMLDAKQGPETQFNPVQDLQTVFISTFVHEQTNGPHPAPCWYAHLSVHRKSQQALMEHTADTLGGNSGYVSHTHRLTTRHGLGTRFHVKADILEPIFYHQVWKLPRCSCRALISLSPAVWM